MEETKRGFLRVCMSRGILQKETAAKVLESICNKHGINVPEMAGLVTAINEEITQLDQQLTLYRYPLNREEYIIFAYTHGLPNCEIHPTLSGNERRYFAILLEVLSNAKNYSIKWHEAYALQIEAGTKPIPMKRKEALVDQWKEQGYLYGHSDDICFGPRTLIEFDFHFRSNYSEQIKGCPLCHKLTYWEIECSKCHVKIHHDCLRSYLRLRSRCPRCKNPWETPLSL